MTPRELCFSELFFNIIDRELLSNKHIRFIYKTLTFDQTCYINWLLNRWVVLRDNEDHYPQKITHKSIAEISINIFLA